MTGGGGEDGSSCDDFEVGRFGDRTIVRPRPSELGNGPGLAAADGDGPVRLVEGLQTGWPKELLSDTAILFYGSSFAGIWPDRFFLVWWSYQEKSRVKVAPWLHGRWGAPILDVQTTGARSPEATTERGVTTLVVNRRAFVLTPHAAHPLPNAGGDDASVSERAPSDASPSRCVVLPRLAPNDGGGGYHEAPNGLALAPFSDDGTWVRARRDVPTEWQSHDQRTYFLFRVVPHPP